MYLHQSDSSSALSTEAVDELNKLFAHVPPTMLREAVIKLYLCYVTNEDADMPQDIEKIDKPAQALIETLGKIAGTK